jgi:hypothetical protein
MPEMSAKMSRVYAYSVDQEITNKKCLKNVHQDVTNILPQMTTRQEAPSKKCLKCPPGGHELYAYNVRKEVKSKMTAMSARRSRV